MIEKIDHIAIAVNNIQEGLNLFQDILGLNLISIEIVEKQLVKVAKLQIGEINIELIEPISPESAVAKFLSKKGTGIHHIAFKTPEIEKEKHRFECNSIECINKIDVGADGAKIVFCHPKTTLGVMIELTDGGVHHESQ